jgi:hypothetical protein
MSYFLLFLYKLGEQEGRTGSVWGELVPIGGRKRWGNGEGGEYCVPMYVNGKMISVETIPGMGGGSMKENSGRGAFKYDIL